MKIDIWTDIVCPFCYIGNTQFKKALSNFAHKDNVTVTHHSYQLMPDLNTSGDNQKAYEALSNIKGVPVDVMKNQFEQISTTGAKEGLTMNMLETKLFNTLKGHQLIHFATKSNKQEQAISAMFESYFTHNEDISDTEVLVSIIQKLGLSSDDFRAELETDTLVDSVKVDLQKASSVGIQGVPFFMIDDKYGISGAQGVEAFQGVLEKVWKENHPLHMIENSSAMVCTDNSCV